jgi:Ca2+-binding RTX toxin-like protein
VNFIFNVFGDEGVDLDGTPGKDVLFGTGNNDAFTGGTGADMFVFAEDEEFGTGQDTITDFNQGQDKIALYGIYSSFEEVAGAFDLEHNRINLGGDDWIDINVQVDTLTKDDFVFHPFAA